MKDETRTKDTLSEMLNIKKQGGIIMKCKNCGHEITSKKEGQEHISIDDKKEEYVYTQNCRMNDCDCTNPESDTTK